jgi:hypothetical protein
MRIATSLAVILAASIPPATLLPAQAQNAGDAGAASGISTSHYSQFGPFRTAHRAHRSRGGAGGASASRSCLTGETRALLSRFEARFGSVKVISTCRPGAVIAGSGRPSQHRYGKAVDFMPKPGQRAAMLAWLRSNANGAVITYGTGHIHFDTGGYRNFAISAKARRAYARAR